MIALGYYILSMVAVSMILYLAGKTSARKILITTLIIIVAWLFYLVMLVQSGVLQNFSLPPRVPVLIVIPAIVLIIIFVNTKSFRPSLEGTPKHVPVLFQSFRIFVELLIFATYLAGIFPKRATFEGLNYDILVGISAIFVGFAVYRGKLTSKGLLIWNILSLVILTVTAFSFIHTYYFTDYHLVSEAAKFVEIPYILLASVLLPTAIFLHVFSIKQIFMDKVQVAPD